MVFFFSRVAIDFIDLKPAASFGMPGKCSPGEMKWAAGAAMRANRYLISSQPHWPAKKEEKRRDFVTLQSMECEMIFSNQKVVIEKRGSMYLSCS